MTPLSCTVLGNNVEAVRFFLDKSFLPLNYTTALHTAADSASPEIMELLCESTERIDLRANNVTPLTHSVRNGRTCVSKILIEYGADVNTTTSEGTPLYVACTRARGDLVELLLQHKAYANLSFTSQVFLKNVRIVPLLEAAFHNYLEIAQKLLLAGTYVNENSDGNLPTPLMQATLYGHLNMVELLLKSGADTSTTWQGKIALQVAEERQHTAITHLLQTHEPPLCCVQ